MADYGGTRAYLPEPSAPAAARPRQAGPLLTALFGVALLGLVVIAYFDPLPTAAPTDYKVSGGGADVSPEQLAQLTKKYDFVKSRHLVVPYGPHPSQVLNFWEALPPLVKDKKTGKLFDPTEAGKPRPLIVNIHGGGWQQQDYRQNQPQSTALSLGISFAAIEYRRVCGPASAAAPQIGGVNRAKDCANLPAPVFDAKRAIQFLKSKAKEWNIDPDRIILKGNSAGGCSSMYLNYHSDMALPNSKDPVERESTLVLAAMVNSGQSTIDPDVIKKWGMGDLVLQHFMMSDSVGPIGAGGPSKDQRALLTEFSPINHLKKGGRNPPIFMTYSVSGKLPCVGGACIHHSTFGLKLMEKADVIGAESYIRLQDAPDKSRMTWKGHSYKSEMDFALDKFGLTELRKHFLEAHPGG